MKTRLFIALTTSLIVTGTANAQFGKLLNKVKPEKKENTEKAVDSTPSPASTEVKTDTTEQDAGVDESVMVANKQIWMEEFSGGVNWFSLTPAGTLVVSARGGLVGIDGTNGKVLWKNEKLGNIDKEYVEMVDGSPYIAIKNGGLLSTQQIIINGIDGSVISDTRTLGVKQITKRYPVPNQNGFVLAAMSDNQPSIFMIDNNQSKVSWKMDKVFEKQSERLLTKPFNISDNTFFIATDKQIYKVNSANGTIEAKVELKTPIEALLTDTKEDDGATESTRADEEKKKTGIGIAKIAGRAGGIVGKIGRTVQQVDKAVEMVDDMGKKFVGNLATSAGKFFKVAKDNNIYYYNNKYFVGIDQNTGKFLFDPFKFDDNIATFIPHKDGAIFATNEKKSELYYLDYNTGKNKWAKSPVLRGRINNISLNEGKIAVSSGKNGNNFVNIIDLNSGAEVTKRDMKVSGLVTNIVMVKRGLIYSTTEETNIQDPETGKDVMKRSLKYKSGGSSVRKDDKFYVINDDEINIIDEITGDVGVFAKMNFKDGEKPQRIELRKSGMLVSSAQNMVLLDFNGKEKYHKFLKAPGVSTAGKIIGGMAAVVGTTIGMANAAAAGMERGRNNGFNTIEAAQFDRAADSWGNVAKFGFNQFAKRFNMTVGSNDYQIILTNIKSGEDKGFTLVKVNKDTGQEEGSVVIGDKKPDYIFDDINSIIYYHNRGKKISGFKL